LPSGLLVTAKCDQDVIRSELADSVSEAFYWIVTANHPRGLGADLPEMTKDGL
jgi:hypothetical protein